MALIIQFPKAEATAAPNRSASGGKTRGMGELVMFTGVRYSRADGGPVHSKPVKRRPSRKAQSPQGNKH